MVSAEGRIRGVVWDWGDTLMRNIPGQVGPMAAWSRVEAMPWAGEALRAMSRFGIQCVASNATDSDGLLMARALDRVGFGGYLSHFFASVEMGFRKPDPRFFLRVARELGLLPRELISVGNDLDNDILPAKAAGFTTILIQREGGGRMPEGVDLSVQDLKELVARFSRPTEGGARDDPPP